MFNPWYALQQRKRTKDIQRDWDSISGIFSAKSVVEPLKDACRVEGDGSISARVEIFFKPDHYEYLLRLGNMSNGKAAYIMPRDGDDERFKMLEMGGYVDKNGLTALGEATYRRLVKHIADGKPISTFNALVKNHAN